MSEGKQVTLTLRQLQDYRCKVEFGGDAPSVISDEPAPLGTGMGPSPVQFLLAAVANCLTDSLVFALRKFKQNAEPLQCVATATVGRNEENRLRVLQIDAELTLGQSAEGVEHLDRILDQFEGFCTVTRSVAQGIPVHLTVKNVDGRVLKSPAA